MLKHHLKKLCFISSWIFLNSMAFAVDTDTLHLQQNTIVIDGNLNDWVTIPYSSTFVKHDDNTTSTQKTKAKVTWDNENLYLAFDVEDTEIVGKIQSQDAAFFETDDLVEFFIDPDGDGQNYLEIGINASGSVYDYVIKCPNASCGGWADDQVFDVKDMEIETTIDGTLNNPNDVDTGYIVECKIPFSSLTNISAGNFTKPSNNNSWKMNLFRIDYGIKNSVEYQAWTPHNVFGFHQPSKFGVIHFKTLITNILSKQFQEPKWKLIDKTIITDEKIQVFNNQGKAINIVKYEDSYNISLLNTGIYLIFFPEINYKTKVFID